MASGLLHEIDDADVVVREDARDFGKDADAVAILEDSMGEEFKHFSMELEFLLRKTPKWRKTAEGILFTKGDIVKHGEAAEEAAG